jgi:hypothetical protein
MAASPHWRVEKRLNSNVGEWESVALQCRNLAMSCGRQPLTVARLQAVTSHSFRARRR